MAEVLYDHAKLRNLYLEDLKRHYPLQKIGTPEEVFPEEEEEEEEGIEVEEPRKFGFPISYERTKEAK